MYKAGNTLHLGTQGQYRSSTLITNLIMEPNIFSHIFPIEVLMYSGHHCTMDIFFQEDGLDYVLGPTGTVTFEGTGNT